MNLHYDNYLTRKYPLLYRDRHASATSTCMVWGFSCGDGWFNIINTLSAELSYPYEHAKSRYEFMVEQNKPADTIAVAKLEMDRLLENHPLAVQVKEKFGTLRFYADNISPDQDKYIAFAENMSARTCEVCGKRGKLRAGGWLRTLCGEHTITKGK
jgi:hypothetical protein